MNISVFPTLKNDIFQLTFEEDLRITQMFSAEEECVDLVPPLYPTGNVENWLLLVEGTMRNTVRINLGKSLVDLEEKSRKGSLFVRPQAQKVPHFLDVVHRLGSLLARTSRNRVQPGFLDCGS